MQAEPARGAAHEQRLEARALEQHARRRAGDLGVEAAHHARERDRSLAVADQQISGDQRALDVVERLELLAVTRVRHADDARLQEIGIERVQRLAELEQHVVGDVDEVGDRAHADRAQALGDPPRRRPHAQPFDHARDVARAVLAGGDRELDLRIAWRPVGRQIGIGHDKPAAQHRDQLARDAEVAEQIASIRGGIHFEQPVVDAERALRGGAERGAIVLVEHDDAGVILGQPELVLGAQHAGRHDALDRLLGEREPAGQLGADARPQHLAAGRGHVGRAAHDLGRGAAALGDDVDQRELVGLRVRLLADDLGDDDAGEPGAEVGQALDLDAGARQRARALLDRRRAIEIAHLEQPAPEHLHQNCSRKRMSPS